VSEISPAGLGGRMMNSIIKLYETIVKGQAFDLILLALAGFLIFIAFYPVLLARYKIRIIHYFLDFAMFFYAWSSLRHNNHEVYKAFQKSHYIFKSRVEVDLQKQIEPDSNKAASKRKSLFGIFNRKQRSETLADKFARFDEKYYVKPEVSRSELQREDSASKFLGYDIRLNKEVKFEDSLETLINQVGRSRGESIFIKGAAGFGKSNLCRYLCHYFRFNDIDKRFKNVFLLEAKNIFQYLVDDNELWPYQKCYLQSLVYRYPALIRLAMNSRLAPDELWIRKKLLKGSLIVIDALDELESMADREVFLKDIEQLLQAFPKCTVVISGRHSSFKNWQSSDVQKAYFFEIQPLDSHKIDALAMSVFSLLIDERDLIEQVGDFKRRITNSTTIEMASNPLLLTLMVLLDAGGEKRLPNDKPDLIKMVINESVIRRKELVKSAEKDSFIELLKLLAVCINEKVSISDTRERLVKKIEQCHIESLTSYASLVSLFEKIGLVYADANGKLFFVHRCFSEYLYATSLYDTKDATNEVQQLRLAVGQDFSEVFYYYCSLHGNVSTILILLLSESDFELKRCVELLAFERINQKIHFSDKAKSAFNLVIQKVKRNDIKLFSSVFLQYKLDKLRLSDPMATKPLNFREASSLMALDKEWHSRNSSLVGLTNKEIDELFKRINQNHADYRGIFSLPIIGMLTPKFADDTIYKVKGYYRVYREQSKRFRLIKNKVQNHGNAFYTRLLAKHGDPVYSGPILAKLEKIVAASLKEWNPNILMLPESIVRRANNKYQDPDYEKTAFESLRVEVAGQIYERTRHTSVSALLNRIFGEDQYDRITELYQAAYHLKPDQLLDYRSTEPQEIRRLILGSTIRMLNALHLSGSFDEFKDVSFILSRLFTINAILEKEVEPWGRFRIVFITNA
jgi:hypothetical protein